MGWSIIAFAVSIAGYLWLRKSNKKNILAAGMWTMPWIIIFLINPGRGDRSIIFGIIQIFFLYMFAREVFRKPPQKEEPKTK